MKFKLLAFTGVLLVVNSVCFAAGSVEAGQAKTGACVACHGIDGNSTNPEWPAIAGQHPQYISKQLKAFRAGQRQNVLMSPMAATLSDQDIEDLAAYFSSQTLKGKEADKSKVDLGQQLYRGGNLQNHAPACIACHGPSGKGNPAASYPAIGGQHAKQVSIQLHAYKKGERKTDQNEMMRNVAAKLSDDEIEAVASYVQGLR